MKNLINIFIHQIKVKIFPIFIQKIIKIYHLDSGETAGDAGTQILAETTILANGWAEFEGTIILEANDFLQITAQTANDINYVVYGMELS